MSKDKITDVLKLKLVKHNDHFSAEKALQDWTEKKQKFMLSRLDWLESSIDKNNYEAYRIAFNQLKLEITQLKSTLDRVHTMLLFTDE